MNFHPILYARKPFKYQQTMQMKLKEGLELVCHPYINLDRGGFSSLYL